MEKPKLISIVLSILGVGMIAIAIIIQNSMTYSNEKKTEVFKNRVDIKKMALATQEEKAIKVAELIMPPRVEVYEGMTMEELSAKLDRRLANAHLLAGKGTLIATNAIAKGVDPYVAVAIMLHETGCGHGTCSYAASACNNFGGIMGYPSCSGGLKGFDSLDAGIVGVIDLLQTRYYSLGINTVEGIGRSYAASTAWPGKIYYYIDTIRAA